MLAAMSGGSPFGGHVTDERVFIIALSEVNECYSLFVQYAGTGPGLEQIRTYYRRMPTRPHTEIGRDFTRTAVWRRYAVRRALAQGQPDLAASLEYWSDGAIQTLFRAEMSAAAE